MHLLRPGRCPPRRAGVTLIELLVSVSIVAILAGLTYFLVGIGERASDQLTTKLSAVAPHMISRPSTPVNRHMGKAKPVPNQYLVTFNASVTNAHAAAVQLEKN